MNRVLILGLTISTALIMNSCGGDDGTNYDNNNNENYDNLGDYAQQKVGVFYIKRGENSLLAEDGVDYKCLDIDRDITTQGVTNENGLFKYYDGDECQFSLNNVSYGTFNTNYGDGLSFTYNMIMSSAQYSVELLDGSIIDDVGGMNYVCLDRNSNITIESTTKSDGSFNYYKGDICEFKLPSTNNNFGYFYSDSQDSIRYKIENQFEEDSFESDEDIY
ncbi:hypothetical protein MNB_SV-15-974 [hydrothermal vent metagenome]|uniref:Uncharacterized protein n=1 Tax=hydrothermal vent metagenome TaxID=652676 RepID=A0A1W1EKN3_9ZZZZ